MKRIEELATKGAEWWANILLEKLSNDLGSNEDDCEELIIEDFLNRSKVVSFEIILKNRIEEVLEDKNIASLGCNDEPDSVLMRTLEESDLRDMKEVLPKNTNMLISTKKGIMLFKNNEKKVLYS